MRPRLYFLSGCYACSAVAGMSSASSPSISWNCLELTKPMLRPGFFVSKIQAIFSISRLLGETAIVIRRALAGRKMHSLRRPVVGYFERTLRDPRQWQRE